MTLGVWDMQVSEPRIEDLERSLGTAASQSPCGLIPAPWPPATAGMSSSSAWCTGLSALVVLPQGKTGIAETKGGESCFPGILPIPASSGVGPSSVRDLGAGSWKGWWCRGLQGGLTLMGPSRMIWPSLAMLSYS